MIKLQLDCRNGVMEKKLSKIGENRFFDRNVEKMNDFAFLGIIKAAKLLSPSPPPLRFANQQKLKWPVACCLLAYVSAVNDQIHNSHYSHDSSVESSAPTMHTIYAFIIYSICAIFVM